MDDKMSILIQSSMDNGVYYTHDKNSLLNKSKLSCVYVDKIKKQMIKE